MKIKTKSLYISGNLYLFNLNIFISDLISCKQWIFWEASRIGLDCAIGSVIVTNNCVEQAPQFRFRLNHNFQSTIFVLKTDWFVNPTYYFKQKNNFKVFKEQLLSSNLLLRDFRNGNELSTLPIFSLMQTVLISSLFPLTCTDNAI